MDLSPAQQLERARERFELGDYYGVLYLLHELVESGKAFADAHHLLGLSYYMVNRPEEALASLDEAVDLNPNYVEANIHRGILLAEMGRGDEAEACFDAARASGAEERGGVAAHYAARLANLHAEVGEAYAEAGQLGLAVEQYERALELGPAFHDLRYRLGRLLLDARRTLEAREQLEQVVEARPQAVDAHAAYGLACHLSGDAATARRVWEAIRETHPHDVRVKAYLAMLDRAAGQ
jgi:tetratricopeptide (TPR) repeat protein